MTRHLAIVSRTDLSFFKGWDGCYIEWTPGTYAQVRKLRSHDFAAMTDEEDAKIALDIVKERMTGGKVKVIGKDGRPELVDIQAADIDSLPGEMIDRVLADMTGVKYDADPLEPTPADGESSKGTDSIKPQTPTSTIGTQ